MSFVPTQFSSFTSNFDFDKLRTETQSTFTSRYNSLRKPNDFFDISRFSKPNNVFELQQRISFNLGYFQNNYILIILLISLYFIITNFPLLILIIFDGACFYGIKRLFGNNLEELAFGPIRLNKNVILTIIILINLPVLLISSPVSTLLWVVGLSAILCVTHAALIDKPLEATYSDAV